MRLWLFETFDKYQMSIGEAYVQLIVKMINDFD